ncbi:MAG: gliding motility-associated C-terminal domain-containing protein [Bacteroidetes bacterium]|nr:gliding motility-associated C-terminal domain-containing protein [Bacteroidota bacterium]
MKMKHLYTALAAMLFHFFIPPGYAQNCIPTTLNGRQITIACPQACTNISYQVPHIKNSTDYLIQSIPYQPYVFTTPGGNEPVEIYVDDKFSHLLNLPFPVCFYGGLYNSFVVGSNGIISFDASQADCNNDYRLDFGPATPGVPQPIPHVGTGTCTQTNSRKYPPLAIMGPYHDLNPNTTATTPDRKIEWRIEGTAPCRKLIVSFYQIALYGDINSVNTSQVVVYESTGIIDIFIENKRLDQSGGAPWNADFAILGLQKDNTTALPVPGKNCSVWTSANEAWRFLPNGAGSRFVNAQIYTLSGTWVADADTTTTTAGVLDVNFPSVCPPTGSTQYIIKTRFASCSDPATLLETADTVTLNLTNGLYATSTATNTDCGPPTGTITVTIPPGFGTPPFTYVLDGGTPITALSPYTFTNVSAGVHTIDITDASGYCSSSINQTVIRNIGLFANLSATDASCPEVFNGTIRVTALNGFGPYQFKLDGFPPITGPNPYTFTNVNSGLHQIWVYDATGCESNMLTINVGAGPGVNGNVTTLPATCTAATNGSIIITANGNAPFSYILDGGTPQNGGTFFTFTNVAPGSHTVQVRDVNGCTMTRIVNITAGPDITATSTSTTTSCFGASNGTLTITPANGSGVYSYSLDGAPAVSGAASYTFTGLSMGAHSYQVFDAAGCSSIIYPVTILPGPALTTTASVVNVLCNGDATGSIQISTPSGGASPYQYSLDGTTWQFSPLFTGLPAGVYTVYFRSSNGCQGTINRTIAEPPVLSAITSMVPVRCNGENNGRITITASGGTPPYQYSINGGTSWQNSTIFSVSAGTYTITIRDGNNCMITETITVSEPAVLTAASVNNNASCDGGNDGQIIINAAGGNPAYRYSLDGVNYQVSNIFNVAPGTYTVYVRDNLGCSTSFTAVVGLTVNLFLQPQADAHMCEGTSVQLQTISNATEYAWTPAAGLNDTTLANPTANPANTSIYRLRAVLGRCTAYDTVQVIVHTAPLPNAGPDGDICYGQSYTLQGTGGFTYNWTPPLYLNTTVGANPVSTPTNTTKYTLSVTDAIGCNSLVTDDVIVKVKRTMKLRTFPFDTLAHPGDQFRLQAISPGINYQWTPATGLSSATVPDPIVTVGVAGDVIQYQVTGVDTEGCKAEGYVTIRVYKGPEIYVPTGFTPNGDGLNDLLLPVPVGIKSYNYFRVFNRWGQLLFSTTTLNRGWDGRLNGKEQPTGTYIWIVEGVTKDNRLITKKGTTTLIR